MSPIQGADLTSETPTDLKTLLVKSVILAALENLMKLDDSDEFRTVVRRRYLDLTKGGLPS